MEKPKIFINKQCKPMTLLMLLLLAVPAVLSDNINNPIDYTPTRIRLDQLFRHPTAPPVNQQQPSSVLPQASALPAVSSSLAALDNRDIFDNTPVSQFDPQVDNSIAENVLRFALNIGQLLSEQNTYMSKSEVFSPLSIMSTLSFLMLGAKGKSYQQLKNLFGLDADASLRNNPSQFHVEFGKMLQDIQMSSGTFKRNRTNTFWRDTVASNNIRATATVHDQTQEHVVKVASGLFMQNGYTLNQNYKRVLRNAYNSELQQLDFYKSPSEAKDYINLWVDRNTYGKIPKIINGELARSTNMILASALYFKGFWENSFFEMATTEDKFYPDGQNQRSLKVKMMATGGIFPYYESPEYNCRIIGLPYKGNETTMYVLQPHQSTRQSLREFQKYMDAVKIEEMISKMVKKSAVLAFPKMHFIRSVNMKSLLNQLGVHDIFTSGVSDLSLIHRNISQNGEVASRTRAPISQPQGIKAQPAVVLSEDPNARQAAPQYYNQRPVRLDRFNGEAHVFSRNGFAEETTTDNTYDQRRITRQLPSNPLNQALQELENERILLNLEKSDLFVEDIFHKVDIDINEHGTEAAAATLTYLRRSGTDVHFRAEAPFIFFIRHDPTKLILFYGIVNEPELMETN